MSESAIHRQTILCVDADQAVQDFCTRVLPEYDVTCAGTGFEALRALNHRSFRAYILEYWLPDWSGRGLCREIRMRDPHVPILFCASADAEGDKARALRAGASAYLPKPIDPELLRVRLRSALATSDQASLNAKFDEECAIQDELSRRSQQVRQQAESARRLSSASIERTARAKALKVFVESGGTLGSFESWWPQVYSSVRANHAVWAAPDLEDARG